jgi:hypothetical protein
MIKTLFKLIVALLVAHALVRFVPPYWNHNQFESEVKERAVTWASLTEGQVRDRVFEMALARGLPVTREQIAVRWANDYLLVDVEYPREIEFLPTWKYEWTFDSHVSTLILDSLAPGRTGR